jgi:hypothetical protein
MFLQCRRMTPVESHGKGDLARLHQEWQELHARLRVQEQLLSRALELYATSRGPRPDALMQEVGEMRIECSQRFHRLMEAVRSAPPT